MHEWFTQPLAAARMAEMRQRATVHRLRVANGRDVMSRLGTPLLAVADRSETRLQRRRAAAAVAVRPA